MTRTDEGAYHYYHAVHGVFLFSFQFLFQFRLRLRLQLRCGCDDDDDDDVVGVVDDEEAQYPPQSQGI